MICDLITDQTYLEDVVCTTWEDLVEIGGELLVRQGSVEPRFIQSIKDTIAEDPKSCVAIGTGKALNELDSLKSTYLNKREPYL